MLLVREIFTCKPGQASKFVKLMKEVSSPEELAKTRIMTDLVGPYNTVVMETEVADLQEWQKMMEGYKNMDPETAKKMSGYTEMYLTGRREIFQIH